MRLVRYGAKRFTHVARHVGKKRGSEGYRTADSRGASLSVLREDL